jgi:hypothetical protein
MSSSSGINTFKNKLKLTLLITLPMIGFPSEKAPVLKRKKEKKISVTFRIKIPISFFLIISKLLFLIKFIFNNYITSRAMLPLYGIILYYTVVYFLYYLSIPLDKYSA